MEFVQITDRVEIEKMITCFSGVFPPPRLCQERIAALSEKFERYGVVKALQDEYGIYAFACFYCNDRENKTAYISLIAAGAKYRGQGYGKAMLDEVCMTAKHSGMSRIRLEVNNDNSVAIGFYKKNGFEFEKIASDRTQYMIKKF